MKTVNYNLLTPNQKKILSFIERYFSKNGFAPSYKEIASKFGLKSDGSVAQYLDVLEEKGYISRGEGSRQILLNTSNQPSVSIPLLGVIAAGNPIEPIEIPEPITVPATMVPLNSMCYALRVAGDSMIDDGIADGDLILVKHQNSANNGETVVAITENGATLKRFYTANGQIRLEPRNKSLKTIFPKELEIRGKFIGLIRKD